MSKLKKIKNEAELVKEAVRVGEKYGESRGAFQFEEGDSANEKIEYIYRLLVRDKLLQGLPEDQVTQKTMKHKVAIWISKQLPKDHSLLQ